MKVKAKSIGSPSPAFAGAFARLLLAAQEKKPELKLVRPDDDAESQPQTAPGKRG